MPSVTIDCASDRNYSYNTRLVYPVGAIHPYCGDVQYMAVQIWKFWGGTAYDDWIGRARQCYNGDTGYEGNTSILTTPVGVMMSFNVPEELKKKNILKAWLKLTTSWARMYDNIDDTDVTEAGPVYWHHLAYADSTPAESISLNDFNGKKLVESGLSYYDSRYSTADKIIYTFDITSLFRNNVYDNVFNAFETALPVESSKPTRYGRLIYSSESSTPPQLIVEYEGYPPEVKPVYPVDAFIKKGDEITFSWEFNSPSASRQRSWVVKASSDGEAWQIIGASMDENTSFKYTGDLGEGKIYWDVVCIDEDDASASFETPASFTIMAAPSAPTIYDFTNSCLPVIRWNALGQAAYEIAIEDGNGNVIESASYASADKAYNVKTVLQNGSYNVKIRIMNVYEMWSQWASRQYEVNAEAPEAPTLSAEIVGTHIKFSSEEEGELWLYKKDNGKDVYINKFTGELLYYEAPSGKTVQYFARKISTGYADSDLVAISVDIEGISLFCDGIELNMALSKEQFMPLTRNINRDETLISYAGRALPVRESGEIVTRSITRSFICDDYNALEDMKLSNNPIIYRDAEGNVITCVIASILSATKYMNRGYAVSCTFTEVEG